jgi:hypothetical protein
LGSRRERKKAPARIYDKKSRVFSNFLSSSDNQDDRWLFAQLISANLERKLARFRDAIERIERLPLDSLEKNSGGFLMAEKIRRLAEQLITIPEKL